MYTYDETLFSDLHKSAYGFRPGQWAWVEWTEASPAQKQVLWDELLEANDRAMEEDRQREADATADFEARVTQLMSVGATDRETAIRWIVESLDMSPSDRMYGGSYVCFELHLPYSMAPTFDAVLKSAA